MAFLHPNYFPFCPKRGFEGVGVSNRTRYQGPFSLEQAMALYWKVASVTISGTQVGPENFGYSFTGSGPSTMSGALCPGYFPDASYPDLLQWGWIQEIPSPPETVFDDPIIISTLSEILYDGRNVIVSGGAYYVAFQILCGTEEGAGIISNSQDYNISKNLQIDDISVPITFGTINGDYESTIDSFTCTLRDPS